MEIYLVGGAVRDRLLNLPVNERDWVVVGATIDAMKAEGFQPLDRNFPVFAHPETGEEYALARTETKNAPGHKGFSIHAGPDVSLYDDLKRRDLTINAMAEAADGSLIDPFDGRVDLEAGVLRHVSAAFAEDPLRVLRIARFAARFARWGFRIAHGTHALMKEVVRSGEIKTLSAGRIWQETNRALQEADPARYFEVLAKCGALAAVMPELHRALGDFAMHSHSDELNRSHALKALTHGAMLTPEPAVRFATLMVGMTRDLSEAADVARQSVDSLCSRLRCPAQYSDLALLACDHHPRLVASTVQEPDQMVELLETLDAFRRPERFAQTLVTWQATGLDNEEDTESLIEALRRSFAAAARIDASDVADRAIRGEALGSEIRRLRTEAVARELV